MIKVNKIFGVLVLGILLILSLGACGSESDSKSSSKKSSSNSDSSVEIQDADGVYDYKSDPSITKPPAKNITIGDGREVSLEYDKSQGDILSYQLYYVDDSGSVIPMGGSTFDDDKDGDGVYICELTTFTSNADGRPGFMEISSVNDELKNVYLGMYPVKFKVSK